MSCDEMSLAFVCARLSCVEENTTSQVYSEPADLSMDLYKQVKLKACLLNARTYICTFYQSIITNARRN